MRVRTVVPFLTLLVAGMSCQSYVAVPVQPATLVAVAQHSQVKVATKADILFVVDDSLSMSGKQDRLAQALAGFTAQLDALKPPVDYQVAVVGTSTGFLRDGAKIVVAFFSDAEDCSDPQQRFSMLVKDAQGNLVDQCAQQAGGDGTAVSSLEPVARYVNFLRALTNADGSPKEVQVAAIVSLKDGTREPGVCTDSACQARCDQPAAQQACQTRCARATPVALCMADCTAECKTFCNGQVPGRRYVEMATAFQGLAASVCSDDAGGPLGRLAAVIGIPKQIELLARPSALEYLRVRVDRAGSALDCAAGQGFDLVETPDGPAVRFTGACTLQPDDVWDIRYLADG